MSRSPSLAVWLIALVLCTVVLALAATGLLVDRFAQRHAQLRAKEHLNQVADKFRDALDHGMARQVAEVQLLAEMPELLRAEDPARTRAVLDAVRRHQPDIAWIGLADPQGKVLAANDGLLEGADVSARPWCKGARDKLFVGDVHPAVLLAKLLPQSTEPWRFVDIALPVAGHPGYVLGTHLSWGWAATLKRELLDPTLHDDGATAYVLSQDGHVLLGPSEGKAPDRESPLLFTALSKSDGHGAFAGLGWQVVVQQPYEAAMTDYLIMRQQLIMVSGAVLLLFVPLAWVVARRLSRPLTGLAQSLSSQAHLSDMPLPTLQGFAEAEVLSAALADLVERQREHDQALQDLNSSLDLRVRDRTAALQLALQGEALNLQRMQNIANSVPALVAHFDPQGRCLFANLASLQLAGLPAERLSELRIADLLGDQLPNDLVRGSASRQMLRFQHAREVGGHTWHSEVHWIPDGELNPHSGSPAVGHYLVSFDVSQLKETELKLQQLSRADALTGLPNRRQFDEHIRAAMARERRNRQGLAVVYLDVDRFKGINDSLGHAMGDEVLKTFAQRLSGVIRTTDLLARLGGDEFVLVCEGVKSREQMEVLAEKLLAAVRAPLTLLGHAMSISTSMGSALMLPTDDVKSLLDRADAALYRVKEGGRNGHLVAGDNEVKPTPAPPQAPSPLARAPAAV